ncbi:MAG: hypothetical protein FWD97_04230 [Defluviitaleaceae bacterium]|nr:hypothetical protein [Defluviitaleaceae bacterium]
MERNSEWLTVLVGIIGLIFAIYFGIKTVSKKKKSRLDDRPAHFDTQINQGSNVQNYQNSNVQNSQGSSTQNIRGSVINYNFQDTNRKEPDLNETTKKSPILHIPDKGVNFILRHDKFSELSKQFETYHRAVLCGGGGFGKTQIASHYAHTLKGDKYRHIWFFNAASSDELENSYRELAVLTGLLTAKNEDFNRLVKAYVDAWLNEVQDCLLVYDNAEGLKDRLQEYLPKSFKGHILFCTRDEQANYTNHKPIKVDVFSPDESLRYLRGTIKNIEEDSAIELSSILSNIPLALRIAVAYIDAMKLTCSQYIELLKKQGIKYLDKGISGYDKAIIDTWDISIRELPQEAQQLFHLCAYCSSSDIPLSMFIDGNQWLPQPLLANLSIDNDVGHHNILNELERFGLLSFTWDNNNALMSIHGLIQKTVLYNHQDDTSWLKICLEVVYRTFSYEHGNKFLTDKFLQMLPHVLQIAEHSMEVLYEE